VITIVGSDDLNLVDAQLIVLLRAGRQSAEQGDRDEKRECYRPERHRDPCLKMLRHECTACCDAWTTRQDSRSESVGYSYRRLCIINSRRGERGSGRHAEQRPGLKRGRRPGSCFPGRAQLPKAAYPPLSAENLPHRSILDSQSPAGCATMSPARWQSCRAQEPA